VPPTFSGKFKILVAPNLGPFQVEPFEDEWHTVN